MNTAAERTAGKISALFTCAGAGDRMQPQAQVTVKAGEGIEGDRYAKGIGFYSPQVKVRHITFITQDGIDVANDWQEACGLPPFAAGQTRRNVVLQGVSAGELNQLVGRAFKVGGLEFIGVELATPCPRPAELSGQEGFVDAFEGRGGLRAQACSDGVLRLGDAVEGVS